MAWLKTAPRAIAEGLTEGRSVLRQSRIRDIIESSLMMLMMMTSMRRVGLYSKSTWEDGHRAAQGCEYVWCTWVILT